MTSDIHPWYRYQFTRLEEEQYKGDITFSNLNISEIPLLSKEIAEAPHHITCIIGIMEVYDELLRMVQLGDLVERLQLLLSMTLLVPTNKDVSE
jgi:hypothetical protein